ncbi:hypothetical protein SDC9_189992 [bioreactor metagenome]|uniref:Na+/H+ antiporter MnhB subunit-related protein domain-containing protein n=1 Tax=bioreactor metagenome TaxID=1076179 RepID=A0A645HTP4_9ZZZZ
MALFHFIELDKREMVVPLRRFAHDEESGSELLRYTLSFMYALFIVLGIYIIVNGADSPGGGFQGGAALATLIMARYLVKREMRYGPEVSYKLEKLVYLLIVLAIGAFLGFGFLTAHMRGYMLLMNLLIGLKVAVGFTAIFQKFIQSGREEDSH